MLATEQALNLKARATLAEVLARTVGREASAFREEAGTATLNVENKGLQDFVTIADKRAEQAIREALLTAFPEDGFMGEESGGRQSGDGLWVVDPIDGTTNFIRGFRHWGVSIAFVAAGKVQIGVIYDAALDKVYSATRDGGASKDGKPIRASDVSDPTRAIAILGHSRRTSFEDYQAVARRLYEKGVDYRRMGAAAIGLARVADGIADLYYERHLNGWDMLAGALIAREAGAVVHVPPMLAALGDGGPIIACAAGLKNEFAFLREQAADLYEQM
ncbi:MAG: inositol monophosphatase family protein [Devosia sp.]